MLYLSFFYKDSYKTGCFCGGELLIISKDSGIGSSKKSASYSLPYTLYHAWQKNNWLFPEFTCKMQLIQCCNTFHHWLYNCIKHWPRGNEGIIVSVFILFFLIFAQYILYVLTTVVIVKMLMIVYEIFFSRLTRIKVFCFSLQTSSKYIGR